jgi:tRNA(Ile)-lysidine synthase
MVLNKFESNIIEKSLFQKEERLLLAISGGCDSVVLAHLLHVTGYDFSLAHCNFKLRAKESDADEKLCNALAKKLKVPFYTKSFDTEAYCAEHKLNIQLAARKLRYEWFHELLKEHQIDYLLTAHHANDVVETLFINLLRGTGIKGLKGIPEKKGQIVRPLLNFTKEELDHYAKEQKIEFRLDKSNLEDKYERNFIRLNIVPALKKINPKLEETILKNTGNFREEACIVSDYLEDRTMDFITQTPQATFINKKKLKHEVYLRSVLHHLISGYGFNETQQKNVITNILENAPSGKLFKSGTHELVIDRNDLVIKALSDTVFNDVEIASLGAAKKQKLVTFKLLKKFEQPKRNEMIISKNKLIFPIIVRKKRTGDKFKPFGMKGFKLISDYLKDEKLTIMEKENCKLMVNGNGDILWVAGYRSDERYKVNKTDTDLLKITLLE